MNDLLSLSSVGHTRANGLTQAQANPTKDQRRAQAEKAAAMLEGLFMRQLMKVMRKSVPESSLFGKSTAMGIYNEMFDGAMVDEVSKGKTGFGLREELLRQLEGSGAVPAASLKSLSTSSPKRAAAALRRMASMGVSGTPDQLLAASGRDLAGVAFEAPRSMKTTRLADKDGEMVWPVDGSSGARDGAGRLASTSGAYVLAAGSGTVLSADATSVVVDHNNGLKSHYRGLRDVEAQAGDMVLREQLIGSVGANNLEFGITRNGQPLQPNEIKALMNSKKINKPELFANAR